MESSCKSVTQELTGDKLFTASFPNKLERDPSMQEAGNQLTIIRTKYLGATKKGRML